MIVNRLDRWRGRFAGQAWERVFTALERLSPAAPDGETLLEDRDIFMRVMSYATRAPEDPGAILEAHRDYIDVQATLAGRERIDWFPAEGLATRTPYDAEKDAEFFERPGAAPASLELAPGFFCVFFPGDAHMAQLDAAEGRAQIRKVVFKIRAALVGPAR